MSPLLTLSWLNPPCGPKEAIAIGKQTLGTLASLPRHRGRAKTPSVLPRVEDLPDDCHRPDAGGDLAERGPQPGLSCPYGSPPLPLPCSTHCQALTPTVPSTSCSSAPVRRELTENTYINMICADPN